MITFTTPATRLKALMISRRRRRRQRRLNRRTAKVENSTSYRKNKVHINKYRNSKSKELDATKKSPVDDTVAIDKVTCEILGRLPMRSLIRFKCVCKCWQLLVEKDSYFKDLQLTHSKSRLKFFCVVEEPLESPSRHGSSRKVLLVTADYLSFHEGRDNNVVNIHSTREIDVSYSASFFGPLNGLIGFYDSRRYSGVRLSNVCTQETTPWMESELVRKYKLNDKFRIRNTNCQLGFDPATKKYKVVCLCNIRYSNHHYGILCEVLTIGDNKWRIYEVPSNVIDEFKPIRGSVYVNGSIYFSTVSLHGEHDHGKVVVFDVGSENFRSIIIPNFDVNFSALYTGLAVYDVDLLEMDDHLTFLCRIKSTKVKLWLYDDVDDDNKGEGCWREVIIELPYSWDSRRQLTFHSVVGKKEIILKSCQISGGGHKKNHSYHLYDLRKKTYTQIEISGIPSSIPYFLDESMLDKIFMESLLSVQ